jgi:hypothetical protein
VPSKQQQKIDVEVVFFFWWFIWKEGNRRIFEHKECSTLQVVEQIKEAIFHLPKGTPSSVVWRCLFLSLTLVVSGESCCFLQVCCVVPCCGTGGVLLVCLLLSSCCSRAAWVMGVIWGSWERSSHLKLPQALRRGLFFCRACPI